MICQMLLFFSSGCTQRAHHISLSYCRYNCTLTLNAVITQSANTLLPFVSTNRLNVSVCVRADHAHSSKCFVLATANCDTINCNVSNNISLLNALIRFLASTKFNSNSFKFNVSHRTISNPHSKTK